jgi:hypothetical protein
MNSVVETICCEYIINIDERYWWASMGDHADGQCEGFKTFTSTPTQTKRTELRA